MSRSLLPIALVVAAAIAGGVPAAAGQTPADCSFPISAQDATGATVTVPADPERVVALAPSAAQTMWAIGAREAVVGMPENRYTDYLADREGVVDVVGDDGQPTQEAVVDLEPDLVLAPNVITNETVANLREAGLQVYRFRDARTLEDVSEKTELTGRLVGEFEASARTSAETRGTVAAVREAVAGTQRPRVYYHLGGSGWTAGDGTFVDDLIRSAGGQNVAANAGIEGYDTVSGEVIAEQDPEVIVVHEGTQVPDDPAIANSTAARTGSVVRVEPNFVNQPGPRVVEPLTELAAAFHPDADVGAAVADASVPEPARCAAGTDRTTNSSETTDGASAPGFTLGAAVVAIGAGALFALRRRRR